MIRRYVLCVFTLFAALLYSGQAFAASRVALVIGVSHYDTVASLDNPSRDADLVASSFKDLGFEVTELRDPRETNLRSLLDALAAFRAKASSAEAAVIYFAGHGVEVKGTNWLLPSDVSAESPEDLEGRALKASQLAGAVRTASKIRLVVLDACRNNPFATQRGWSTGDRAFSISGLGNEVGRPDNVVILLATQQGKTAVDGSKGGNSPFAKVFSKAIGLPGLPILSLPTRIAAQMRDGFGIDQRPDQQGFFAEPRWQFAAGAAATAGPAKPDIAVPVPRRATGVSASAARADAAALRKACLDTIARPMVRLLPEAAIPACRRAVDAQPQDSFIRMQLGRALVAGRDYLGAREAFSRAADEGNAWAMVNLGALYRDGLGSAEDPVTALAWFEKAAALNNAAGMYNAAIIYHLGVGRGQPDFVSALSYYQKASKIDNYYGSWSLWNIGCMYEKGHSVQKSLKVALSYFETVNAKNAELIRIQKETDLLTNLNQNNPYTNDLGEGQVDYIGKWGLHLIRKITYQ